MGFGVGCNPQVGTPHQLRLGRYAAKATYQFAMGEGRVVFALEVLCVLCVLCVHKIAKTPRITRTLAKGGKMVHPERFERPALRFVV